MTSARLDLLGGFRLTVGQGRTVDVSAKKNRALLGILALAPRVEVTRDRLASLLWSDRGEEQARSSLRQALVALRKDFTALDADPLALNGDRVALDPSLVTIDATEFLVASAGSDPVELRQAAELYAGPFLDGLNAADNAFEEWLREARADLASRATRVLVSLAGSLAGAERVVFAERLTTLEPLREASHLALMQAHLAQGHTALAIRQYETCKLLLKRELGVEPGEDLQDLRRTLEGTSNKQPPVVASDRKPAVAVLPFNNLSGDASQQYLSDGITEDIITELSRFSNFSVAARYASFHHVGKGLNVAQVARELGVTYFVEGTVRKSGERLRITAQLIDARTGNHVWAERYDRESHDIFAVQDEVVSAIVATLEGRMVAAGAELARKKPTASWSAYDCLLQGRELGNAFRDWEAVPFFEGAIAIDPDFAQAHAWLAIALVVSYVQDSQSQRMRSATQAAKRALTLDGNDSTVHRANALVMLRLGRHERAGFHYDRAVALNPADVQIRAERALWLRLIGRPDEALFAIDGALERSSFCPHWYWVVRGQILFDLKRYREAIDAIDKSPNKYQYGYVFAAAAYAYLGDAASAQQELANAEALGLKLSLSDETLAWPYAERRAHDHLLDGLRKAGVPE